MLAKVVFILAFNARAENLLARSEGRRLALIFDDPQTEQKGGCYPGIGGDDECVKKATEGECRDDSDCYWKPSCPKTPVERPTNLFEKPEDENFCWLIRDTGKTRDEAKKKGACSDVPKGDSKTSCKDQCQQSYRRSPRGKKARPCYWDPSKEKCRGGTHYVVDEACAFLPPARKTRNEQCEEWILYNGPRTLIKGPTDKSECMARVMQETQFPPEFYEPGPLSEQGVQVVATHLGYSWEVMGSTPQCFALAVLQDPDMHHLHDLADSSWAQGWMYTERTACWLNVPLSP